MRSMVLLAALCACTSGEAPPPVREAPSALSAPEKERIQQFWSLYRSATQARVRGDWQQAVQLLRRALQLQPRHEDGLYYLGNALFEMGRYEEAAGSWQRLLEVDPRATRAHLRLGALFASGLPGAPFDLERAEREIRAALEINGEESGAVLELGEVLLLKGELAAAQSLFAAVSRTNARSSVARYLLGYTYWRRGEQAAALAHLRAAAELNRDAPRSASASSEGDTRSGRGPMLAASAARGDLFAARCAALEPAALADAAAARREYEALAAEIARLRR